MKNQLLHLLIYDIDDYPDMGGGIQIERFENADDLEHRVNEIINNDERANSFEYIKAESIYEFKEVKTIIKLEIDYGK